MFRNRKSSSRARRSSTSPARRWLPRLENLETRLAPATVVWTSGVSGSWHDPSNWTESGTNVHRVPVAGDDAYVASQAAITITLAAEAEVDDLYFSETLDMNGQVLRILDPVASGSYLDTLNQQGGTIELVKGTLGMQFGELDGVIDAKLGATVALGSCGGSAADTFNLNGPDVLQGAGKFEHGGCSTLNVNSETPLADDMSSSGTIFLNQETTTGAKFVLNGHLKGDATLIVPADATMTWTSNGIYGPGSLDIYGTMEVTGTNSKTIWYRTLNNYGAFNVYGNFGMIKSSPTDDSAFNNHTSGTLSIAGDYIFGSSAFPGCDLNNDGQLQKTAGAGAAQILCTFNHEGSVSVGSGALGISAGVSTGAFSVAPGAALDVPYASGNYTFDAGSTFDVDGTLQVGGNQNFGTVTINADATVANLLLDDVNLAGTGDLTVTDTFTFLGGTLMTDSDVTIAAGANLDWSGGVMDGTKVVSIANGATMSLSGPGSKSIRQQVHLFGSGLWTQGRLDHYGTLTIKPGGSFGMVHSTPEWIYPSGAIENQGLLFQEGAKISVWAALTNAGTVRINQGILEFMNPYVQNSGNTLMLPGTTLSAVGVNVNGGVFNGSGTILAGNLKMTIGQTGSMNFAGAINGFVTNYGTMNFSGTITKGLTNNGVINVGGVGAAGLLRVRGPYTQGASGVLNIEIGGTIAGAQYDQLELTRTATLNGTLNVSYLPSYSPNPGNVFDVLKYGSVIGTFVTMNLPAGLSASYLPKSLQLSA